MANFFDTQVTPEDICLKMHSQNLFTASLPDGKYWDTTAFNAYLSLVGSDILQEQAIISGPGALEITVIYWV